MPGVTSGLQLLSGGGQFLFGLRPAELDAVFRRLVLALDALGGGPVLYVGDSETDAATARAARLPFALFTEGYRKTPVADLRPEVAFSDYRELAGIVSALTPGGA